MKAKQKFSSMGASDKTITVVGNVFLAVFVVAVREQYVPPRPQSL